MYTVAVRQDFVAQHYLLGVISGPESRLHSHDYKIEVRLEGERLSEQGYLIDIDLIKENLETLLGKYRDRSLNDAPEFAGLNPSVEHFARILCAELRKHIEAPGLQAITVRLWEDENAWASFRQEL
ncbi:MAG TPA: 6-carboxytetrahydropterin synthase [Pyrinomonadaceae bacterium]|jgi:6-pyruvoyltetrahydropterin/6-carboxytetrahydropterin synthase